VIRVVKSYLELNDKLILHKEFLIIAKKKLKKHGSKLMLKKK
jgi:hypothetical protein